jgi:hypothetical protein
MDNRGTYVDSLGRYLAVIVEPTFEDLKRNPGSVRLRNGHAEVSWRCPLLGEQRKTFARIELFRF